MKVICAWCKKDLGEKEPFELGPVSHGICESCQEKLRDPLKHTQADMDKESKKLLDLLRPCLEVTRCLEGPEWPSESLVRVLMATIRRIKFDEEIGK